LTRFQVFQADSGCHLHSLASPARGAAGDLDLEKMDAGHPETITFNQPLMRHGPFTLPPQTTLDGPFCAAFAIRSPQYWPWECTLK
jgi:hypothetical protein